MKKSEYLLKSFYGAGGTFAYVSAVAWFLFNGKNFFGGTETFLIPIFMLLLLIISASLTGFMVLGKPILLYMEGKKKESVILFFATLGWLAAFIVLVAVGLSVR